MAGPRVNKQRAARNAQRAAKVNGSVGAGFDVRCALFAVRCALFVIVSFSFAGADEVGNKNRKANKLYSAGKYAEALKLYDDAILLDPSDGKLKMNRGSTLYRLDELDEAEKSYLDALSSQINKKTAADAHYNLGNIQYKQGEAMESSGDASSARKKYTGALENYINTLKLRPSDMDAKWNLQLAHKKIELLKNQQDQNQDQDNQDDQDNKDDKDKQQGGKGDNDQDNKDQQDKDNQDKDNQQQDNNDQSNEDQQKEQNNKEEAERLIEQYADDADTLNKPRFQRGRVRQPEKDW
jgi:tetratricopeptide (TPR) repeat protein